MKKIITLAIILTASSAWATKDMAVEAGMAAPEQKQETLKGKVLETMDSGGYTYIYLDLPKGARWVAIPETKLKKDEIVEVSKGTEMGELYSKSLDRKFPSIIFSAGVVGDKSKVDTESDKKKQSIHASVGLDTKIEGGGTALLAAINIDKATGSNAYKVEELVTKKKELAGKEVRIKGKIVKASKGIMGKNWYHFRDGSGNEKDKTNNIVITGRSELLLGDTITATGTLNVDKDFGGGYFYEVIIEDANFEQ